MTDPRLGGVFSLLLTPFYPDQSIDWAGYDRYVAWQLGFGPDGLFAVCGSSEMKWLTREERLRLARAAVSAAGRTPVVATANLDPDAAQHAREIEEMAATGVAGVVLVPPPGLGESQDRLGDYFGKLMDRAPCPVLLYEWPQVQPYLIEARVYGGLVQSHGAAGIKDTTCTMEGIRAKIEVRGESTVFQANAPFLAEAIRAGAGGIMAITSAAAADLVIEYWREEKGLRGGRAVPRSTQSSPSGTERSAELHELLVLLDCALVRGDAYPASAKYLARLRGLDMSLTCRNPVRLVPECQQAVRVWYDHLRRFRSGGSSAAARSRSGG